MKIFMRSHSSEDLRKISFKDFLKIDILKNMKIFQRMRSDEDLHKNLRIIFILLRIWPLGLVDYLFLFMENGPFINED